MITQKEKIKIENIKLKSELTFNIIGDLDQNNVKEDTYEITLKKIDNNKEITATCIIPPSTDKKEDISISCTSHKTDLQNNDELTIHQYIFQYYSALPSFLNAFLLL